MSASSSPHGRSTFFLPVIAGALLAAPLAAAAEAEGEWIVQDAYVSLVAEHFRLPADELRRLVQAGATVEELPVLLRISQASGIPPTVLLTFRRRGESWLEIARRYQLGAEIFHLALPDGLRDEGIRRARELYRDTPEARWGTLQLSNQQLVDLANLQVLVRKTGRTPGEILDARSRAGSYPAAVPLLVGRR